MAEETVALPVAADGLRVRVGDKLYTDWSHTCYQVCTIELRQYDSWAVLDKEGNMLNLNVLYHTPPYLLSDIAKDLFDLIDMAISDGREQAEEKAGNLAKKIVDKHYTPKPK